MRRIKTQYLSIVYSRRLFRRALAFLRKLLRRPWQRYLRRYGDFRYLKNLAICQAGVYNQYPVNFNLQEIKRPEVVAYVEFTYRSTMPELEKIIDSTASSLRN